MCRMCRICCLLTGFCPSIHCVVIAIQAASTLYYRNNLPSGGWDAANDFALEERENMCRLDDYLELF